MVMKKVMTPPPHIKGGTVDVLRLLRNQEMAIGYIGGRWVAKGYCGGLEVIGGTRRCQKVVIGQCCRSIKVN